MIKAYFAIKLACYLIVVLIVVMLVAAGIAAILIDKFVFHVKQFSVRVVGLLLLLRRRRIGVGVGIIGLLGPRRHDHQHVEGDDDVLAAPNPFSDAPESAEQGKVQSNGKGEGPPGNWPPPPSATLFPTPVQITSPSSPAPSCAPCTCTSPSPPP